MTDLAPLLDGVLAAIADAGSLAMKHWVARPPSWDKSPDNPVTQADLEVDSLLHDRLLALLPTAGWLSEETRDEPSRLQRDQVWIVDPIDGTKEFIEGVPQFAISIALAQAGKVVLSAVFNPARDELYSASQGGGAWLGGRRLSMVDRAELQGSRALASRTEVKNGEFSAFEGLFQLTSTGSIAYKLALIAAGEADLTFSQGAKWEWDVAGGVLLVQEAGGRAVGLGGRELRFNQAFPKVPGIVACPPGLVDSLLVRLPGEVLRK